jgi:4-amino-4-deoxy-L-arabinose transferase-like glycosyltransferase
MTVADSISLHPLHLPLHGDAHPAGGAYAVALGSTLLGQNLVGYRLASVIAGTALIWIVFCLARPLGRGAALTAAALVAANEYLFGISRLATEESTYIALSAAAVLAFQRAVAPNASLRRWIAFGAILGLGLAVKEMLVLWIPVFILEIVVRRGYRELFTKGPALAAMMLVIGVLPDIAWNLFLRESADGLSNRGLTAQARRFGMGISAGPSALFLRPLYFKALENAVSEYPSMTSFPGGLLLAGAVSSLFLQKTQDLRMWIRLGAVPFLLFTFLGKSTDAAAEFWWSDLSVTPFILLTTVVLARLPPMLMPAAVVVGIPGFLAVAAARENCYPPAAGPPAEVVERC